MKNRLKIDFFNPPVRKKRASTRKFWTIERDMLLTSLYPYNPIEKVCKKIGVPPSAVKNRAILLGLKKKSRSRFWDDAKVAALEEFYPTMYNCDVAKLLGTTETAVSQKACLLKIKKSAEFIRMVGIKSGQNAGAFKKGDAPWNKGKKGVCTGGVQTQFKKGHQPHNTKSENTVTLRYDSDTGRPWLAYRVKLGQWIPLAQHVFAQYYGEVPAGMVIRHKNGNRLDCRLENLECVSKKENRIRNSGHATLTDRYIASLFVGRKIKGPEREELKAIFLNHTDLINAKRNLIILKRELSK